MLLRYKLAVLVLVLVIAVSSLCGASSLPSNLRLLSAALEDEDAQQARLILESSPGELNDHAGDALILFALEGKTKSAVALLNMFPSIFNDAIGVALFTASDNDHTETVASISQMVKSSCAKQISMDMAFDARNFKALKILAENISDDVIQVIFLFRKAIAGRANDLEILLKHITKPEIQGGSLCRAARMKKFCALDLLLRYIESPEVLVPAICLLTEERHYEGLKLLVQFMNRPTIEARAIYMLAKRGQVEDFKFLAQNLTNSAIAVQVSILVASHDQDVEALKFLVENIPDVVVQGNVLFVAARTGSARSLEILLQYIKNPIALALAHKKARRDGYASAANLIQRALEIPSSEIPNSEMPKSEMPI